MDDITRFGCQHITGRDAEGFLTFCEAAAKPGSSYCSVHVAGKYRQAHEINSDTVDLFLGTWGGKWRDRDPQRMDK